ncbi:MAG: prephenate dehydratase [Candidatus Omnitrophica bacterium]|nr:prephenate dehydratase [Candidatus Omnitrophota bacterium]
MGIKEHRQKIDRIDTEVVRLLNQRATLSIAIGQAKLKTNKGIYAPDREKEIFDRLAKLNKGPLSNEAFYSIYREVMSGSISLEKSLHIAYLGTEGSFTHLAAKKKFGSQVDYDPCSSILEVFNRVEHGECDYGVVPIENSIEGAVTHTFDILVDSDLKVCSQVMLKISHNVLSNANLQSIKKIYSNPQVFGQCRDWLHKHLPDAQLIPMASTTLSAQKAHKEKNSAALASTLAAEVYGLKVLKKNIQDVAHNTTRFLVVSNQDVPPTGNDRTSILFSIKDRVGALHAMLTPFFKYKINLTKIESRPSKKRAWDYYFFVDFEGHREDKNVKKALDQLEGMCKHLKIVGSYPVI